MPSTQEIEIVLRNPKDLKDKLSYYILYENTAFNKKWTDALNDNLNKKLHLEKNYCFLGWADSPRNAEHLCQEINKAIDQINIFNRSGVWQQSGLAPYEIQDFFSPEKVIISDKDHPVGNYLKDPKNIGLTLNHDPMNRLHRYFEDLQGEAWGLSRYYKFADYETKYAIRQLNVLCHELENWVEASRKKITAPEWQRASQITTFLNAPRYNLDHEDYELFKNNRYDRELGGVYLHWAQIGKTHFEVFRDEHGQKISEATCSAISALKYYSGEFDVEWGNSITRANHNFHNIEITNFRNWLTENGFEWEDPLLSLGYIKIGQVDLQRSFGTNDFFKIINTLSNYLDLYKIKTDQTEATFDYVWSDSQYKQMQIDFLKPAYDWSSENA